MIQQVKQATTGDLQGKDTTMNRENELEKASQGQSPIRQFFRGRCILITGSTGFIGKVFVEKILRCCPEIEKMYLLMRPKRGLKPEERLKKLFQSEVFRILKEKDPFFEEKVSLLYGDIDNPNLGLSEEHHDIIKTKISVVFHSAASVRYIDHLRSAVKHNVESTKRIMELCQDMPKLVSLVYVSTAFVHRDSYFTAHERVVPCDATPDELLNVLKWMDDDTVSKITPFLLRDKKDNYFLTKALAENVIVGHCGSIPTAIVRPSIVGSTWKDPFPGWCDALQGPSGLLLAASKGFLRTLYSKPDLKVPVVPVDIVVNTMIAASWFTQTRRSPELFVLNCVTDDDKLCPAGEDMLRIALKKREEYPLQNMYRYPDFTLYYSPTLYKIHSFWDHYVPAYFIDFLLYVIKEKPFMVRLYKRIETIFSIYVSLGMDPWIIKNKNYHLVEESLSGEDRQEFFMDMKSLEWAEYFDECLKGGRMYLAHEDPSNIPYAKRKVKIWWFTTTVLKWIIIFGLIYIFYQHLMSYIYGV